MVRMIVLAAWLAGASAAAAAEPPQAGRYRLAGEPDVASELVLTRDGRFHYFLSAGALDERSQGRWSAQGATVTLVTEPKPVPPAFAAAGAPTRSEAAALTVEVAWPDGRGIAGVDLRIGFAEGEPLHGYTQEDGWSLPAEERRTPLWLELAVPMHDIGPVRFPIDPAAGNALAFTLTPNDLGLVDLTGTVVEAKRRRLIVRRGPARLRYDAVRD